METAPVKISEAERAFQRSKVYRLLSYCFFSPEEELVAFLKGREFIVEMERAVGGDQGAGDGPSAPFFAAIAAARAEDIVDEYVRYLTLKSKCPPYETEYYRSPLTVFSSEEMADIGGFYRAFGMGFAHDRPDHIAMELEFMHLATLREAEAASRGDAAQAGLCRSVEQKFLQDHLGRWVDIFSEALAGEGSVFYAAAARFLGGWIALECRALGASPQKVTEYEQVVNETDDDNSVCLGRQV